MARETWIDTGSNFAAAISDWFVAHTRAQGSNVGFSAEQLSILQEVVKAGLVAMSGVLGDKFEDIEKRLAATEAFVSKIGEAATHGCLSASLQGSDEG